MITFLTFKRPHTIKVVMVIQQLIQTINVLSNIVRDSSWTVPFLFNAEPYLIS